MSERWLVSGYHFLKVLVLLLSLQIVLIGSRKLEFILQVEGKPASLMPANGDKQLTLNTFYILP